MPEEHQNNPISENDDLLSDIPAAVAVGSEEHGIHSEEQPVPQPEASLSHEEPSAGSAEEEKKPRKAPPDTSVMKVSSFMGALILLAIPIVNFICAIKWIFRRGNNRNRRNLGIAAFLLQLIFIALVIGGCVIAKYQFNYDVIQHLLDLVISK